MIGAALGWKYNNEPGIETVDGVLTKWPKSLGTKPTKVQIKQIIADYKVNNDAHLNRIREYKLKGWHNIDDLIDDILERGVDAVKVDRDTIKAAHPKT